MCDFRLIPAWLVLFVTPLLQETGFATEVRPHIVIILVDDMGYGDAACYNSASGIDTPVIDSLAQKGMKFTDAHAPGPLCHMSRYGLLTGEYPFRIDVQPWRTRPLIRKGRMTIASLARRCGYHTSMVGKWHLGFAEDGYEKPLRGGPVDRGFHSYFGIRASTDIPPYFYIHQDRVVQLPVNYIEQRLGTGLVPLQGPFWRGGRIAPDLNLEDVLPRFTDEAIQGIRNHAAERIEKPLMLYLAYPAPHSPWLPSTEFHGKSHAGTYGDFMMMVDTETGRVLQALDDAQMTDNTLLIFTSDNGPMWFEQDCVRFGHDSSGGLRGMKADVWEGGHRVPFLVRWPGRVPARSSSSQLICFTDLLATFADLLKSDLPQGAGPDSLSFLPALTGQSAQDGLKRDTLIMQAGLVPSIMSIRMGDWKLITDIGSGGFSSREEQVTRKPDDPAGQLYNLADDLSELHNLYEHRPEIVRQLLRHLNRITAAARSR